jgi:hypothetical protein
MEWLLLVAHRQTLSRGSEVFVRSSRAITGGFKVVPEFSSMHPVCVRRRLAS